MQYLVKLIQESIAHVTGSLTNKQEAPVSLKNSFSGTIQLLRWIFVCGLMRVLWFHLYEVQSIQPNTSYLMTCKVGK